MPTWQTPPALLPLTAFTRPEIGRSLENTLKAEATDEQHNEEAAFFLWRKGSIMSNPVKAQATDTPSLHVDRLIVATNRGPVEYYVTKQGGVEVAPR